MQTYSSAVLSVPPAARPRPRSALLASSDRNFRQRLNQVLTGLRWQVREVASGSQAWAEAQSSMPEAVIVDSWLPDLELAEFLREFRASFPKVDVLTAVSAESEGGPRSPYRQELLYAMRSSQDTDTAAWNTAATLSDPEPAAALNIAEVRKPPVTARPAPDATRDLPALATPCLVEPISVEPIAAPALRIAEIPVSSPRTPALAERLPELIGNHPLMLEVSRRIRLVAPRSTPVLIEGPTGSGKELVAEALHRLSTRNRKPFVAINCAAIPEALLEAELFGHTRGAFTGAVQGRVGRIESADGGTLFLDEIGEMPLSLQSKLLRFVESGELQRVGDNETVKVDVRIVAATHQQLSKLAQENNFRADLYYRLAVFLIRTPALADHAQDLPLLVEHFLRKMGREEPVKSIEAGAMAKLATHTWPGNVREVEHVLERAAILAGESTRITADEIDFGLAVN
jgi:DNA-binding NtrC family response regulator